MEKEDILKQIRKSNLSSWELNQLVGDIKILERRKLDCESISTKQTEIEGLQKRINEIDLGNYEEPMGDEFDYTHR